MPDESYFNTTNLKGGDLKKATVKAETQESKILSFFRFPMREGMSYAPHEVHKVLGLYSTPLTSVRRAMTNLTKKGLLHKTTTMVEGNYGKPSHTWALAVETD